MNWFDHLGNFSFERKIAFLIFIHPVLYYISQRYSITIEMLRKEKTTESTNSISCFVTLISILISRSQNQIG